jgi:hypothetical protein
MLLEVTACTQLLGVKDSLFSLILSMYVYVCLSEFSSQADSPSPVFCSRRWIHFRYGAQSRPDGLPVSTEVVVFNLTDAPPPWHGTRKCSG